MTDMWDNDYKLAQQHAERLQTQVNELKNAKMGQNTTSQKVLMRATWQTLMTDMQNLDKLKYLYENEPGKFNLSKRELAQRLSQIEQILIFVNGELSRDYRMLEADNSGFDGQREDMVRGADGEFDNTRDQSNKQLIQVQKNMLKEQD